MRYKILSEGDSIKLKIYGEDKDDLFKNGAIALANILFENIDQKRKLIRGYEKVLIESGDLKSLLENFLNKVLDISVQNKKAYSKVKILRFSPSSIEAHVSGAEIDNFDKNIKKVFVRDIKIKDSSGIAAVLELSL